MSQPVIGVTTQVNQTPQGLPQVRVMFPYLQALARAGAVPVLLPSIEPEAHWRALYERVDGVLFTGGGDVTPARYGGNGHPRVNGEEPDRDSLELALLQACLDEGKPFLGICRGLQVINVGLGGTLYADLADEKPGALKHDYYPDWPRDHLAHSVRLAAESWLVSLGGGETLPVNSLHHQGIRDLAPPLRVDAWAPDDLIEAVSLPGHPFGRAVQWHPEWLAASRKDMQGIFDLFVQAVQQA